MTSPLARTHTRPEETRFRQEVKDHIAMRLYSIPYSKGQTHRPRARTHRYSCSSEAETRCNYPHILTARDMTDPLARTHTRPEENTYRGVKDHSNAPLFHPSQKGQTHRPSCMHSQICIHVAAKLRRGATIHIY